MKTCSNCGKQWDDSVLQCAECGTSLAESGPAVNDAAPADAVSAPQPQTVDASIPSEGSFAPAGDASVQADNAPVFPAAPAEPKKKKPLRIILPIAAVLLILIIVGAVVLAQRSKGGSGKEAKQPRNYSVYIKDNDLFFMGEALEKPVQYGENVYKDPDDHENILYFNTNTFNDDGSKFFYAQNIETEEDTYTLYYREVKKADAPAVKIAEDVKAYLVLKKNNGVLYANSDGSIYLHDFKERTKIVSESEEYRFSDDQKRIVYLTDDQSLYVQELDADKIKIDSDVDDISYASGDLQTIIYLKEGTLYRKDGNEERRKLDTDVEKVITVYDTGEVYYTKLNEAKPKDDESDDETDDTQKQTLYDYVTEPKDQEAKDEKIIDTEDGETENSRILIRDAKIRAWTREALREIEIDVQPTYSLYCSDGTETTLISKTFSQVYDSAKDAPVLAVKCYDNVKLNKLSLTEIIDAADKEEHFFKTWNDGGTIYESDFMEFDYYDTYKKGLLGAIEDGAVNYIIIGTTAAALEGTAENFYIDEKGTQVMYVSDAKDNVGTLYQARIENGAVQPAEVYDNEVRADYAWGFTTSGKFLYEKNYNADKTISDLYMDKALIDYDVHNVSVQQSGSLILYTTDYDQEEGCYTLNRFENGEKAKVAEDVDNYDVWDNGTILYLCNPSSSDKYDLYMSKDGVNTNLDFDVIQFLRSPFSTAYGLLVFRWTLGD